jgi:DNA-binding CsgD family transcriptional regulator
MARGGGWRPFAAWWHLGLADVAMARDDADAVISHARAALDVAQAIGNRRDEARAVTALGLAALSRAETDVALGELSTALTVQRDIGDQPGARRTLGALCEAMDASGQEERSARLRAALARGDGGLEQAIGMALRGRGSRARVLARGLGGLTQAEAEVANLAAGGVSNPEIAGRLFMSRSTVKTHLSRVYAKLGVANRTELAGALASLRHSG